jgi:predicted component of type VI protein secretion system
MKMAFWPRPTPQWLTTVFGGAFVLFVPSEQIDPNSTTEVVSPVGSTAQSYRIPIESVVDAMENVGNPNQMELKRMPAVLDAGAATVNGTYVAKSVARKVKETRSDGRVILQDTNNSTEDFEVMDTPQIRRYDAQAPSWNSWK